MWSFLVQGRPLVGLGMLIVATNILSSSLVSLPSADGDDDVIITDEVIHNSPPHLSDPSTDICLNPPGYDANGERNQVGYHNLLSTRESLEELAVSPQQFSVRILCIFPPVIDDGNRNMDPPEDVSFVARSTFGRDCDGHVFMASDKNQQQIVANEYPVPRNATSNPPDDVSRLIHHSLAVQSGEEGGFDWFYIMPTKAPYQYFVANRARRRLRGFSGTDSPIRLRSTRFFIDQPPPRPKSAIAQGSCDPVGIINRPALKELLRLYDSNKKSSSSKQARLDEFAQSIPCENGWGHRILRNPHKNSELSLPTGSNIVHAFHRVQRILDKTCDSAWRKQDAAIALDERGRQGYRHDATAIVPRNSSPQKLWVSRQKFLDVCQALPGTGPEGPNGAKALDKIQVAKTHQNVKLLCMVYTHESRHDRLRSIVETWGKDCDGFFAASTKTDPSLGAINLLHEGEEVYENMWLKVRAMWQYAYDNYRDEYDYFTIGGDDHFFIPENFRYMTQVGNWAGPYNASQPWFLGGSVADSSVRLSYRYCGGGSGYSLNRKALNVLVEDLFDKSDCWPHWKASDEDRIISSCFRSIGIQCFDTNDARNETRYHPWNAEWHSTWTHKKKANYYPDVLEKVHGIAQRIRMGQISTSTVSFHLKPTKPDPSLPPDSGMRRYYALLHDMCKNEH